MELLEKLDILAQQQLPQQVSHVTALSVCLARLDVCTGAALSAARQSRS